MKNRGRSEAQEGAVRSKEEELAAAAGRANLRLDVAKQNVRLAKEELKRARKRYKEAKREAKRARKRTASARKAWKQERRKSERSASEPADKPGKAARPEPRPKPAAARLRARSARRGSASPRQLSASSAAPRRG